eukprot:3761193-Pleurochrysis_carterae.AAC.3
MLLTFDALFTLRQVMRLRFDLLRDKERHAIAFAQAHAQAINPSPRHAAFWEQLERISLGRHKIQYPHVVQHKLCSRCLRQRLAALQTRRTTGDGEDGVTLGTQPAGRGKEGPSRLTETKAPSTTLASSVAVRLDAARSLHQDKEMCIPMRAQLRIATAPEAGGGRSTLVRTAAKVAAPAVDPNNTCVLEFAKLVASKASQLVA